MYSSQLVRSVHLQMQTLIPPRLCSVLILLEYFILRLSRTVSSPRSHSSSHPLFPLPLSCLSGKFVFESFLLTDRLDLLSVLRLRQTTELTLAKQRRATLLIFVFSFSANTNSFASPSPRATRSRWKLLSWFSFLIPHAMLKPSLCFFFFL